MAAGRTFLRQEELITEKSMDVLPHARKRELQYQHLPDGDAKKPGHIWSGLKSKLILYWQSVKNETPGRNY